MKDEIQRAETGEEESRRLKQALEEKESIQLQIQALEGQSELLDHKLKDIEAKKQDLEEQMLELKQTKLVEIPVIKHALGLYANITNLRWQYDTEDIKGHVSKADDVKSFEFPKDADMFEVCNNLWEMI